MRLKIVSLLGIVVFLIELCLATSVKRQCGANERPVSCVNLCNNCGQEGPCPPADCYKGCDCIPGHKRSYLGDCVPEAKCSEEIADPSGSEVQLSAGGCPNPNACIISCQLRAFQNGLCLGPRRSQCNCFSLVPPEPIPPPSPGALEDSPPVHEVKKACPNRKKCLELCRKRNPLFTGICVGKDGGICRCCRPGTSGCPTGGKSSPRPVPRPVPRPIPRPTHSNPAIKKKVPIPDLASGGCPINKACSQACKLHGYGFGQCVGPRRLQCRCHFVAQEPDEVEEEPDYYYY